jgi:hypothetical protein
VSYWDVHGWIFLVGLALLGFFLAPSLVVAMLATMVYWETNPILCVIAWVIFLSKFGGAASQGAKRRASE